MPQVVCDSKANNSVRKMSLVICFKCKKKTDVKATVLCSICDNRFELNCDGYPEQTYRLLSAESKKKWRCKMCIRAAINKKNASNNDNISNITIRKKQKLPTLPPETTSKLNKDSSANNNASMMDSHVLSDHEILSDTYISPNKLSKTLDGTLSDVISMAEMKDTLSQCKKKLNMTELELDNLILENNSLHKQIEKLTTENNTLKSLCHSSSIIESTPNPKQKRILTQRNAASTPVPFLQDSELLQISNLEQKVQRLQKQLKDAEQEITDLTQQIISLTQRLHNNSINNDRKTCSMLSNQPTYVSNQLQLYNYPPNITNYPPNPNQMEQPDKTIYILGAQRCVGLAATTISSRLNAKYDKYRIIAETKPNAVTDEIVKSCKHLQLKPGDKLVLSVGENDDNAKKVLSQLNDVLRKFNNNTIIVLSVAKKLLSGHS
ncbi:hypothetical protein HF086_007438 [Spodoptera exigua]|uniref:PHD-type domain-containing protein n=1 Tax=Spodoptera exigua TaxID=7107 RepID=A0A922MT38_SPOEX|nr:hypothetical protein HF086_007438 [Spodoptera exigua]